MNIDLGIKIHNRFDIEVKDIVTGEIVQRAEAENIVLNSMFNHFLSSLTYGYPLDRIYYGSGTGTLSASRTALFSPIGYKTRTKVEYVYNVPPLASYGKNKIVLVPSENVGVIITEVGNAYGTTLLTHALLKDSEGNQISIGPKTDTQEITIYSTIYAQVTTPDYISLIVTSGLNNELLKKITHENNNNLHLGSSSYMNVNLSSNKEVTIQTNEYSDSKYFNLGMANAGFNLINIPNKTQGTGRIRFESSIGNGKVWSILLRRSNSLTTNSLFRIVFPNSLWQGYHFEGKSIGLGDGNNKKFNLPWSDINTTKEYKIYVDGVLKTKDVDYTLANSESETSVIFTTAPASNLTITGDWWVDYIPKDSDHVLDLTFTITYGEGA